MSNFLNTIATSDYLKQLMLENNNSPYTKEVIHNTFQEVVDDMDVDGLMAAYLDDDGCIELRFDAEVEDELGFEECRELFWQEFNQTFRNRLDDNLSDMYYQIGLD